MDLFRLHHGVRVPLPESDKCAGCGSTGSRWDGGWRDATHTIRPVQATANPSTGTNAMRPQSFR